jgi:cation transport ATPase
VSLRLARRHRLAIDATLAALLVSGIAWLALDRDDAGDAWRTVLHNDVRLHALAGLVIVYLVGTLWLLHIRRAWRSHRNRVAGVSTLSLMVLLVATGYALGYADAGASRAWIARAHWIGGLVAAAVYIAHRLRGAATRPPT